MYPIRLERDTLFLDWPTPISGHCTAEANPVTTSFAIRSDGVVYTSHASMSCSADTGTITAGQLRCNGLHLSGAAGGNEFTPYQISVRAIAEDVNVQPVLIVGESNVVTNAGAGNTVTECQIIGLGGPKGLDDDLVIVIGENTVDKNVCLAVGFMANATGGVTLMGRCYLSARRLIGSTLAIIDTTKL